MNTNFPELQKTSAVLVNNTYSYINNTGFYSQVNRTFFDYYFRVVRRCAWWLDGYVFDFHDQQNGIFSTRLAASVVKGVSNTIIGERLLFKQKDGDRANSLHYINKWSDKTGFQNTIRRAVQFAAGLGTSMIKANKSADTLWSEPVRLDNFYFETDFRGQLLETVTLIKHYANVLSPTSSKDSAKQENYYLVEHRYFENKTTKAPILDTMNKPTGQVIEIKKRVPMVVYVVKRYVGNTMSFQNYDSSMQETVRWDSLPQKVRDSIKTDYNVIRVGEPQQLPFDDWLGCELLRFNGGDISLPQTPFGSPLIYDVISELMLYDLAFSYYARDMYYGKGIVLMPKGMSQHGNESAMFTGYDKGLFQMYDSVEPDKQKPQNTQFELRAAEWEQIQDNLLRKIATKIGMSPKTIASYLSLGQTQKTATEVDSEDDATISYIQIQRSHLIDPINRFIEHVLNHGGEASDIVAVFGTPSLVNKDKIIDRAIRLYREGFIDELEALSMIYPEDSNDALKTKAESFKLRMNEKQTMNPFGITG